MDNSVMKGMPLVTAFQQKWLHWTCLPASDCCSTKKVRSFFGERNCAFQCESTTPSIETLADYIHPLWRRRWYTSSYEMHADDLACILVKRADAGRCWAHFLTTRRTRVLQVGSSISPLLLPAVKLSRFFREEIIGWSGRCKVIYKTLPVHPIVRCIRSCIA